MQPQECQGHCCLRLVRHAFQVWAAARTHPFPHTLQPDSAVLPAHSGPSFPVSHPVTRVTALKSRSWGATLVVSQDRPFCLGQAFTYKLGSHPHLAHTPGPLTLQCLSSTLPPILTIKQQGPGGRAAGSAPRRLWRAPGECQAVFRPQLTQTCLHPLILSVTPQSDWHLSTVTAEFTPARSI